MIERPSAKPGIVNTPDTTRADESTSSHGQSVEQRPVHETASAAKPSRPLAAPSDSFAISGSATNTQVTSRAMDRGLDKNDGKPVGPRSRVTDSLIENKRINVERGESWDTTLARFYDKPLTPELVRLVAKLNGQKDAEGSPPEVIYVPPSKEDLYYLLHPGERAAGRDIIKDSKFVIVEPGQTIQDVIRTHYGKENAAIIEKEDIVKVLGEAALYLNDSSRYTSVPGVLALPSSTGLKKLVNRMKSEIEENQRRRDAVDEIAILPPLPPTPGRKLRELLVSDKSSLYTIPTEGARYQTEWNDRLADVVLYVYRDELAGLSPEDAEKRLQDLMLAVARVNDLTTVDIGAVRELYLPEVEHLNRFMKDKQVVQNSQRFKRANNLMWKAILETSTGAKGKALAIEQFDFREAAPDGDERMKQIAQADDVIKDMEVDQAFDKAPTALLPYVGTLLWVVNALRENQEVKPGEIALRRADETTAEYAQRLFNGTASARELEAFEQHPEMLLAVHLKVMSRNAKFEPGQREALQEGLSDLGLMGADGNIDLTGCTSIEAIDAITARTFLDNVDIDLNYEEGESIDAFFSRVLRESPVEGDQEAIRQLLFFNVMAKRQLTIAEQSGSGGEVEPAPVNLDDVEMSMGLRSGVGYENFGSALSDYERMLVAEVFFDEPVVVVESQSVSDDTYVSERAERVYTEVLIACDRREDRTIELTDAQKEELKEAFLDMIRMLAEVEDSVDRYELRIQEGMRVVMSKLISGEPLGAPASWFG